jgi:hypothetical protein
MDPLMLKFQVTKPKLSCLSDILRNQEEMSANSQISKNGQFQLE